MKLIKSLLFCMFILGSANVFARGGDDVGNGSFAYKQSVIILKMASAALEEKINTSTFEVLEKNPSWRKILQTTLKYTDLDKFSKKDQYRGGRLLQMNYTVKPANVIVLKAYFQAFAGRTDTELEDASLQVQKLLLHEAAHIWGYKEDDAEKFAIEFLKHNDVRPSGIDIKENFCSCVNGVPDIISTCSTFCANKPESDQPILYVETLLSEAILRHNKLGNLYNWCNVQFSSDQTTPQCQLEATDGTRVLRLPVNIRPGQNSFEANVQMLSKNRPWILKLVESKTGGNLSSSEFTIKRVDQPEDTNPTTGKIETAAINQYTCLTFGGFTNSNGNTSRTTFARVFYYFLAKNLPSPIPPSPPGSQALFACHDEMTYPGNDSIEYERLDLNPGVMDFWDATDIRFKKINKKLTMNKILEDRLLNEYGINEKVDLFNLVGFTERPGATSLPLGYVMAPFTDKITGNSYCPTSTDYQSSAPLFRLLGDYMDDTEGLYLAEKEAETVRDENSYKVIYGTMFVRESTVKDYGFYIKNGERVKADAHVMNSQTINFYWPVIPNLDPLLAAGRKMFTVRTLSRLNGNRPTGLPYIETTDKRVGCIPKL